MSTFKRPIATKLVRGVVYIKGLLQKESDDPLITFKIQKKLVLIPYLVKCKNMTDLNNFNNWHKLCYELSDFKGTQTHNYLLRKQTINHLAKLSK